MKHHEKQCREPQQVASHVLSIGTLARSTRVCYRPATSSSHAEPGRCLGAGGPGETGGQRSQGDLQLLGFDLEVRAEESEPER